MSAQKPTPLVSIIIPVYNGSNFMCEAIDSALAQTYRNIEVLLINDGSTDGGRTTEIAKSYGNKIRYFEKSNGGVASALNLGISEAQGEFVSWLSHDDVYKPEKIELQIQALDGRLGEAKIPIVYCPWQSIDSSGAHISTADFLAIGHNLSNLNFPKYPLLKGLIHGCALLIPKKAFTELGFFDENLKTTQDYALWMTFFNTYPVLFVNTPLVLSRVHPEQGSKTISSHNNEQETLWRGIIEWITPEDIKKMNMERDEFYRDLLAHVRNNIQLPALTGFVLDRHLNYSEYKVTIIIPFHNRIELTKRALLSVLNQSHSNLEVLLVNDGSTEPIDPLVTMANDRRVKLVNIPKSGAATARNTGLQMATGDFVAFLDSDDEFRPEKVRTQLRYMVEENLPFTFTSYITKSAESGRFDLMPVGKLSLNFPAIYTSCPIATPTVMVRKDLYSKIVFPVSFRYGEDVVAWSRVAKHVKPKGLNIALTLVHTSEKSAAYNPAKYTEGMANIMAALKTDAPIFWLKYKLLTDIRGIKRKLVLSISDRAFIKQTLYRLKMGFLITVYREIKKTIA